MDALLQDLRYALRTLAASRGFTAVALLCLALGIGINTTIFSAFNALYLRPLPFAEPDRLVAVHELDGGSGGVEDEISYPNFVDWTRDNGAFSGAAVYFHQAFNLAAGETPEYVRGARVSPSLFGVLGVAPALGRGFREEEGSAGSDAVAVLGYGLWQRRFGGDPRVVGSEVRLDGRPYTVLGVMPAGFAFPETEQLWTPLVADPVKNRGSHWVRAVARLRPGVTREQAEASLGPVTRRLQADFPETNRDLEGRLAPFRDNLIPPDMRPVFHVMLGAVGFVLLIACANVANLLLARAAGRRREIAVRAAMGAGRGRIVRQLLTESVLVALAGGALGVLLARWGVDVLRAFIPEELPYWVRFDLDGRVLAFTAAVSVATGILFGLAPALRASRADLQGALKDGTRGSGARQGRLRGALVVSEVALSLVLLVGAMLMVRSFLELRGADPGLDASGVLTTRLNLAGDRYASREQRARFAAEAVARLEGLPQVERAAAVSDLPLSGNVTSHTFEVEGQPSETGRRPSAVYRPVTAGFFQVLGIPVVRGRGLSPHEVDANAPVMVVNETFARQHFSGADPIGWRVRTGSDEPWFTVVGVSRDVREHKVHEPAGPTMYVPFPDGAPRGVTLALRTRGEPALAAAAVRAEMERIDPGLALFDMRTMREVMSLSFWDRGLFGGLFGVFAALALVLAAVGIYGVMAYAVASRAHEIGVRMALGARAPDVVRMVVRQAAMLAGLGVGIGLLAALGATRVLAGMLYGVTATDPATFLLVPLVLGGVALLAAWVPARRAARVDPMVALRAE
ncbi:MAG TPA: ABC transporter permease [Longimicrobiaceae bacterium]|nr:ABC transporter permease [Longimicrobiaceae bacterium]